MNTARIQLLFLAATFAACGNVDSFDPGEAAESSGSNQDETLRETVIEAPPGPAMALSGHVHLPQVVYVNFDGPRIADCACSDAPGDRSLVIGHIFGSSSIDFAPYTNASSQRTIVANLRAFYADYNVEFVLERPAQAPYTMLVVSPTNGPHHGVAPQDCSNANPNDIAFVYSIGSTSADTISRFAAHELGHSFGLAHARDDRDIMQWASTGRVFRSSPIDSRAEHYFGQCFTGSTQDGPSMLTAALGPKMPAVWNGTFLDDDASIFEAAIEKIAAAGITSGCSVDPPKYCPNDTVTRGQMAAFLTRALNLSPATRDWFADDENSIFEDAINRVAHAGITVGCGPDRYCPNDEVTRGQMAVFLDRALGLRSTGSDYFDDDIDRFYENSANKMFEAGITTGCGTRRYCGDDPVTRGQMAAFLARALGL